MYMLLYGTMPDELFALLLIGPLGFATFILADVAMEWWRGR